MGRRNWLFAGSDEGAERAAVILTVLETAKRAGIDRRAYLHDLLVKLSDLRVHDAPESALLQCYHAIVSGPHAVCLIEASVPCPRAA